MFVLNDNILTKIQKGSEISFNKPCWHGEKIHAGVIERIIESFPNPELEPTLEVITKFRSCNKCPSNTIISIKLYENEVELCF